jgi:hypothetical protein
VRILKHLFFVKSQHMAAPAGRDSTVIIPSEFKTFFNWKGNSDADQQKEIDALINWFVESNGHSTFKQQIVQKLVFIKRGGNGAPAPPQNAVDLLDDGKALLKDLEGMMAGTGQNVGTLMPAVVDTITKISFTWDTINEPPANTNDNEAWLISSMSLPQRFSFVFNTIKAEYSKQMALITAKHQLIVLYDPYLKTMRNGQASVAVNLNG